jgi:hypothetical protein
MGQGRHFVFGKGSVGHLPAIARLPVASEGKNDWLPVRGEAASRRKYRIPPVYGPPWFEEKSVFTAQRSLLTAVNSRHASGMPSSAFQPRDTERALRRPLCPARILASPYVRVPTRRFCMPSESPESADAEVGTGDIKDLLKEAGALAERVAKLRDGPRKEQLKAALSELQAIADQLKSEDRRED